MFHQPHSAISRPAFPIIVAHNILIIRVWIFSQIPLDKFSGLIRTKPEQNIKPVNISHIKSNRMSSFYSCTLELHEIIRLLRRSCKISSSVKSQYKKIQYQSIILKHKRSELQTMYQSITICMVHIFVVYHHIVFICNIVCQIVIHYQS